MGWIDDTKKQFEGAPNYVLTIGLLAIAAVFVAIAIFGHPLLKAAALAWAALP